MIGYSSNSGVFKPAVCNGAYGNPNFTNFNVYYYNQFSTYYNGWGNTWTLASNPNFNYNSFVSLNIKIWSAPEPIFTSGDLTTSPFTSSPLTTSPLTTSPITTGEVTTAPVTSSPLTTNYDITTGAITTGSRTSGSVTSGFLTTGYTPTVQLDIDLGYQYASGNFSVETYNGNGGIGTSFVPRVNSITSVTVWLSGFGSSVQLAILSAWTGGTVLGSDLLAISTAGVLQAKTYTFTTPIAVIPGKTYFIQLTTSGVNIVVSTFRDEPTRYRDGSVYTGASISRNDELNFQVRGYFPQTQPAYFSCPQVIPDLADGTNACVSTTGALVILKPNGYYSVCGIDFLDRDFFTATANMQYWIYESAADDVNSQYTRMTVRSGVSANTTMLRGFAQNIVVRPDRFYMIGFSCVSNCGSGLFYQYTCGASWDSTNFQLVDKRYTANAVNMGPTYTLGAEFAAGDGYLRLPLRFYLQSVATTGLPIVTSSAMTSGIVATTSPASTGRVTSGVSTSGSAVAQTSSPITTVSVTSGSRTSGVVVTSTTTGLPTSTTGTQEVPATSGEEGSSGGNGNRSRNITIGAAIGGAGAGILLVAVVAFLMMRKKKSATKPPPTEEGIDMDPQEKPKIKPLDPMIPMLRNIEIKKKLGAGSFGDVFLGSWNGTKVALKKLKNNDAFEEFIKEAGTLSQVIHPNCVQFLGIFTSDTNEQYIVVEYLPKGGLRTLLQERRDKLNIIDLLNMMIGAAKGLAYLESKSILHRDIALRNLLAAKMDGEFTAKVSDFGLSRTTSSGEYQAKAETKLPIKWTAPEVLKGGAATVKNDIWAFGITMWEIATYGQEPFAWLSNREAFLEIPKGERLHKPENCPQELFDVMMSTWTDKPESRPTFVEIVKSLKKIRKSILIAHPEMKKQDKHLADKTTTSGDNTMGTNGSVSPPVSPGSTQMSNTTGYSAIPAQDDKNVSSKYNLAPSSPQPIPTQKTPLEGSGHGVYEKSPNNSVQE